MMGARYSYSNLAMQRWIVNFSQGVGFKTLYTEIQTGIQTTHRTHQILVPTHSRACASSACKLAHPPTHQLLTVDSSLYYLETQFGWL